MSWPLARIASMYLRTEEMDNAFAYFRDVSAPLVVVQDGSLGILGAGNRETGYGCAISFWDTREHLDRSNGVPEVVEALHGYAQWMAGPFFFASYEVVAGEIPSTIAMPWGSHWMRTTSVDAPADQADAILERFKTRLSEAAASSPACVATMLLSPLVGERIMAIEIWSSNVALTSWDINARLADQRMFREGIVEAPPTRESLQLFGMY